MPCRLRIKVYEARDLPFRKAALWDAYVEVKFDGMSEKTDVVRQSVNPVWNKAVRWDVPDDKSLQDAPLEVCDHDSVSNNVMGSVFIDLNCLLNNNDSNPQISGWFPIFDTFRGFRGDLKIKVRLEFFRDANAFAPSSTEVMFFSISAPLALYNIDAVIGFAEELLVEDDPEYHWTDQFRASRISNAERSYLMYRLAGRLRRQIGKKVRDLGGNAVLAYAQHFDMIEKSIIARGCGTVSRLSRLATPVLPPSSPDLTEKAAKHKHKHAKRIVSPSSTQTSLKASSIRDISDDSSSEEAARKDSKGERKEKEKEREKERDKERREKISRRASIDEAISSSPRRNSKKEQQHTASDSDSDSERERRKERRSRRRKEKKEEASSSDTSSSESPERKDAAKARSKAMASVSDESSSTSSASEREQRKAKKEKKRKKDKKSKSASTSNVTSPLKGDDSKEANKDKDKETAFSGRKSRDGDEKRLSPKEDEPERDRKKDKEKDKKEEKERDKEKEKERARAKEDESSSSSDAKSASDSSFSLDQRPRRDSRLEEGARPALVQSASSPRKDSALEDALLGTTPDAAKAAAWLPRDVQLLTIDTFPPDVRMRIGSIVASHSVKLTKNAEHVDENMDSWWLEVREEVKSHAQALACSYVVGYSETTTVLGDLLVLSGVGTAANLHFPSERRAESDGAGGVSVPALAVPPTTKKSRRRKCSFCHIPYSQANPPFPMQLVLCLICKKKYVPEVLMSTCEPPADLPITGVGRLLEARVCRPKKTTDKGEATATAVSDAVPFLQYDLHQQIMYKLKVHGLNAIFGLRFQLTVGASMIIAVASGTAVFLPALPPPPLLHLANIDSSKKKSKELSQLQQKIMKVSESSREQLSNAPSVVHPDITTGSDAVATTSVEEFKPSTESSAPEKGGADDSEQAARTVAPAGAAVVPFVVEVEDEIDADSMAVLLDPDLPDGFWLCSTDTLPGSLLLPKANLQMVTAIRRVEWDVKDKQLNQNFSALFHSLFSSLLFKFRDVTPVCICSLRVDIQIPDEESVELIMNAVAVLLHKPPPGKRLHKKASTRELAKSEDDTQFSMDVDPKKSDTSLPLSLSSSLQPELEPMRPRAIIELTPSSFIPGARIEKYLGRVNLHLIKERMSFNSKETKEEAGTVEDDLGLFTHELITEAQALLRANVAALGGNALICYRIDGLRVNENTDSNSRGYCLISVSGDALVVRPTGETQQHHHHHRRRK